jgi:hypothetical protein
MNDILDNKTLRSMPYDVPEGYFDDLQTSLQHKVGKQTRRWPAFVAAAASLALLISVGGWLLSKDAQSDFTMEDYIVFSDEMTSTIMEEDDMWYADAATEDDMIEYLIDTGAEIYELY